MSAANAVAHAGAEPVGAVIDAGPDPAFGDDVLHDVAIVGFGPTGAVLANLLVQRGLRVLVVEREAEIYALPRAIHFDAENMRIFQTLGLAAALEPQVLVSPGMKFVDAAGRVLIDYTRSKDLGPQGWHASYRFHQPVLESLLRAHLAQHGGATVRLRHDLFALEPKPDHVVLRVEDTRRGRLLQTRARYVVGCDGARSLVRRLMGTELDDLQAHERWLVLDLRLKRPRPDLGDHSLQFCDPSRPATYVRGVGDRRRWEIMLMPGDDPQQLTRPEGIWPLLSKWIGPEDADIERPALYTFHSVVARGWRSGRLMIAGDAAHQTPPFMGQGMCAGVRDAVNLAWKLADVVQGHAAPSLLDTYESERAPHAREFIETAVRLGGVIQDTDVERARARDARMAAQPEVFRTPTPPLGPGAHDGVREGSAVGRLAPQPVMPDGRRLDDAIGYRFAVIAPQAWLDALPADAPGDDRLRRLPAEQADGQAWLKGCGVPALLLRPDRHVAGVALDVADLQGLVSRYLGGRASVATPAASTGASTAGPTRQAAA